jgi:DNA repair ATPase RecN
MIASKVNALKRIVDNEFSINLNQKKKRSMYVSQGIRVFSKILYDKGVSKTSIAKSLGKNHATIMHHLEKVDVEIETYPEFREKYKSCVSKFEEVLRAVEADDDDITGLVNEVHSLRDENNIYKKTIEELKARNRVLLADLRAIKGDDNRVADIQDMIRQRVPVGEEKEYHDKISRLFNGVGLKEYSGYEHIHSF